MDFALDEQQRDFAASIDAALGAADLPGTVRAWSTGDVAPGRKVWEQLANLGVTALIVSEKFDGLDASPAHLVGAAEALLTGSVEYAKQRSQFGRVIGSYQAIKHKLADVHIAVELARPLVYGAALTLQPRDVSAAKVAAGEAGLLAARTAL